MKMDNAEEVFHFLEEFSKRKPKSIPQELNDYLVYVARTGDPVYQWPIVKCLFKEKLLNVITDFYETAPGIDIPPYPNVDPFNYDTMKNSLLERLDTFTSAPFTVQRICELLTCPRKQYNRVDKFMRAIEKNILVVSTREPGVQRHVEPENGEPMEPIVNGSDNNSEYNVDVEMEDMSWKENSDQPQNSEPQPSSSDAHISVDDIEARLKAKTDNPGDTKEKIETQYESVTPPELNVTPDAQTPETDTSAESESKTETAVTEDEEKKMETSISIVVSNEKEKTDVVMASEETDNAMVIPEIKVDDAEMTEKKLNEETEMTDPTQDKEQVTEEEPVSTDMKDACNSQPTSIDDSSSDSTKEEIESKLISEVSTSSEESSSSSDVTDGNSNSPKTDEAPVVDVPEESNQSDSTIEEVVTKQPEEDSSSSMDMAEELKPTPVTIQSDNYSISDVNSELPQPSQDITEKVEEPAPQEEKEVVPTEIKTDDETENPTVESTENMEPITTTKDNTET